MLCSGYQETKSPKNQEATVRALRFPNLEISSVQMNSKSCMGFVRDKRRPSKVRALETDGSACELKQKGKGRRTEMGWGGMGWAVRFDRSVGRSPQPRSHAQTTPAPGPDLRLGDRGLQRGREYYDVSSQRPASARVGLGCPRPTRTDGPAQARAQIS